MAFTKLVIYVQRSMRGAKPVKMSRFRWVGQRVRDGWACRDFEVGREATMSSELDTVHKVIAIGAGILAILAAATNAGRRIMLSVWRWRKPLGRSRRVRSSSPAIATSGRPPFVDAVAAEADHIARDVGLNIKELQIVEADPGAHKLVRLIDTLKIGDPRGLRIFTDQASLPSAFWREVPAYAARLAELEREFRQSGFFGKVVAVAVQTEPLGLALSGRKETFKRLIRTIPLAFHSAMLVTRAAKDLPEVTTFLRENFQMDVTASHIGRYVRLMVLSNVCVGAQISLGSPRLLDRLSSPLNQAYTGVQGASIEHDLLQQADDLKELLRVGHSVLVALTALDLPIRD
jgi:hypothetical protein